MPVTFGVKTSPLYGNGSAGAGTEQEPLVEPKFGRFEVGAPTLVLLNTMLDVAKAAGAIIKSNAPVQIRKDDKVNRWGVKAFTRKCFDGVA